MNIQKRKGVLSLSLSVLIISHLIVPVSLITHAVFLIEKCFNIFSRKSLYVSYVIECPPSLVIVILETPPGKYLFHHTNDVMAKNVFLVFYYLTIICINTRYHFSIVVTRSTAHQTRLAHTSWVQLEVVFLVKCYYKT